MADTADSLSHSYTPTQTTAWRFTAKDFICVHVCLNIFSQRLVHVQSSSLLYGLVGTQCILVCLHQSKSPHTVYICFYIIKLLKFFFSHWVKMRTYSGKEHGKVSFWFTLAPLMHCCRDGCLWKPEQSKMPWWYGVESVSEFLFRESSAHSLPRGLTCSVTWQAVRLSAWASAWSRESYADSEQGCAPAYFD